MNICNYNMLTHSLLSQLQFATTPVLLNTLLEKDAQEMLSNLKTNFNSKCRLLILKFETVRSGVAREGPGHLRLVLELWQCGLTGGNSLPLHRPDGQTQGRVNLILYCNLMD